MRKDFRKIIRLAVIVISSIGLNTSILAYKLPETAGHYKLLPINYIYINNVEQYIPEDMGMAYTDNKWRTQVPLRFISEKLGHKIDWVESSKEIKIDSGEITLKIDNPYAFVNRKEVLMDTEPFIDENRTYVPLRFISETLGYKVEYKVEGVQSYIYIQENTTKEETEIVNLYGFPIPKNTINVNEKEVENTGLPAVNWQEGWEYIGIHIPDGEARLPDESYKLENLLKLKYDTQTVQELMEKFEKEDYSKTEFKDGTYIKFSRSSDEHRMIYIGYLK